jgi:hypothetical protein
MRSFFVFLLSTFALSEVAAQDGYGSSSVYDRTTSLPKGKHFFVIPPSEVYRKQAWYDSVYLFPSFQQGRLELTTGYSPTNRPMMNYNMFLEAMDIKSPGGEITELKKTSEIKFVFVGDHKFIYEPSLGYLEVILEGKASVARRSMMKAIAEASNGSKYPITTGDVRTSISRFTRYYWVEEDYFIIDDNGRIFRSAPNVLKGVYPKQKGDIKTYSKANRIDYQKKEDVLKVVGYANEIGKGSGTKD